MMVEQNEGTSTAIFETDYYLCCLTEMTGWICQYSIYECGINNYTVHFENISEKIKLTLPIGKNWLSNGRNFLK